MLQNILMAKKVTQAVRMRWYMRAAKEQVMDSLEWSEEEYGAVKYAYGMRYMRLVFRNQEDREVLEVSRHYWGWWKLQWHLREVAWLWKAQQWRWSYQWATGDHLRAELMRSAPFGSKDRRRASYLMMHNPEDLAECGSLDESYCKDMVPTMKTR
jgi:hypothetical protein